MCCDCCFFIFIVVFVIKDVVAVLRFSSLGDDFVFVLIWQKVPGCWFDLE